MLSCFFHLNDGHITSRLYEQHMKLIELRKESKAAEKDAHELELKLQKVLAEEKILEENVGRYQSRQRALEMVELLKKKRLWCEYAMKRQVSVWH